MVDVQSTSEKLKDRARRIVIIVTGFDYDAADKLLKRAHWNVKAAIVMQKTGLPYTKAVSRLRKADGLDARGDRRGHRAAPARAARRGAGPAGLSAGSVSPMHLLDLVIIVAYLAGNVLFGAWFSRSQHDVKDYFVGGRSVPWWAIMGSIVATETSTVTFISVPGVAYTGNWTFLQLVMGYMIGRIAVSIIFVPAYFRGELLTVYQLLGQRFGGAVKRFAAGLFLITRSLADGVRLFATGLVLAALAAVHARHRRRPRARGRRAWNPTFTILVASVLVMGATTILYTYLGGMTAVIWTDVIQLVIYLVGAGVAAGHSARCGSRADGPRSVRVGGAADKFTVFDFTWDVARSYTFWSGVVGGAFLTTATHGTDQLMVQRYLCSRSPREARVALLTERRRGLRAVRPVPADRHAVVRVLHRARDAAEVAAFTVDGRLQTDRIFPHFIVTHLPPGVDRARDRGHLRRRDVDAVVVAQLVVGDGDGRLLHAGVRAQRRSLPPRVAVDDGRVGPHPDHGRDGRHPVLEPGRRRGARHRLVHQRHHPGRVPARHVRPARAAARGVRRHRWPGPPSCSPSSCCSSRRGSGTC